MPDDPLEPFREGYVQQDDQDGRHTFDISSLFPMMTQRDRDFWHEQIAQEADAKAAERDRLVQEYVRRNR